MPITLICHECGSIHQVNCPECNSTEHGIVGRFNIYLPDCDAHIELAKDSIGTYLKIRKPSGDQNISLPLKGKSNANNL